MSEVRADGESLGRAGLATAATIGLFIVGIRLVAAGPPPDPPLASLGFAAVYLSPVSLALIGHRRGHGPTLAAAALLCAVAAVTSFTGVTLPFLIPAALLAAAAARRPWRPGAVLGVAGAAVAVSLVVAAWYAVVMLRAWQCVSAPAYEACGDDPTTTGGLIALGLVGAALALAFAVATAATRPARPIIPGDGPASDAREP